MMIWLALSLSAIVLDSPPAYESAVRPLFEAKCVRCHGQDQRKAGLDLSGPAGIRDGGESGPIVVSGKPEESLLFEKLRDGEMPPPNAKDRLSDAEIDAVRRWIEAGASLNEKTLAGAAAISQHDVLPILLRHCAVCHGSRRQEGGLNLRSKASMLRGGKSGPAIVPGRPDDSLLIRKARAGAMPPNHRLVEASVKPLEPLEIETLARWVAAGAPESSSSPDVASSAPDPLVSDQDRDFWAFRPPKPPAIPDVQSRRVRNPIDAFVTAKLEAKGLTLAPEADRRTLIRRAALDLTGLPPDPDDVSAFLADPDPLAYEKLIDRLLASPRYGERWARYWLDAAGYADSEGKREQDLPRPHAWRYRDYVIRSLNDDKPYDRFLLEQIAGDELADYESASEITPELYDNLTATGFLRMAPDASWANITGYALDRIEVIADEVDVLGSAVMGLTLKCARCHSHKFDPIPQRDYYRLTDVFKGAYDEYDWLKPDVRPGLGPVSQDTQEGRLLPHVTLAEREARRMHNLAIQADIEELKAETPSGEDQAKRIRELEAKLLPEPRIQALWDRGEPSPTYLYRRGDYMMPGPSIGPGVPSVLTDGKTPFEVKPPWPGAKKTGRRLALGRWLTRPDHPLTARVFVNRLWARHFGSGIVKTLGNFGKAGSPPSHPELLDWLALEFVRSGWSVKAVHRLMMTSASYRQSSAVTRTHETLDPENQWISRMPMVRLDAEALYDTMLWAAGQLDETRYGPAIAVEKRADGLITPVGTDRGWRRLIYVRQARKEIPTHLETFDYPQMNPNCLERRDSTVPTQALHLMNNGMVRRLAEHFADRVIRETGPGGDSASRIDRVYRIALGRPPDPEERSLGMTSLRQLAERTKAGSESNADRDAFISYCRAIFNSAAFLYAD